MNKFTFTGNGRNKDFYFTFPFFTTADIVVKINNEIVNGYGIFCIPGTNNNDFPFTGGHIHFATAPKSTDIVTIERKLQLNRLIDYQPTIALNPTTVNQDMNYFFELLKDIKSDLAGFAQTYADFTDTETAQNLLTQIEAVMDEIDNLGDISTINTSITNLGTTVSNLTTSLTNLSNSVNTLTTSVGTNTTNIGTIDNRTTSILDYVIETQLPTSDNNYTWYRKYKSGWVEQGGRTSHSNSQGVDTTITLPIEMSDKNYCVSVVSGRTDGTNDAAKGIGFSIVNASSFIISMYTPNGWGSKSTTFSWYVSGISA
jgi:hypothetical protein